MAVTKIEGLSINRYGPNFRCFETGTAPARSFFEVTDLKNRLDITLWAGFDGFDHKDEKGMINLLHADDAGLKYKLDGLLRRVERHIKANKPAPTFPSNLSISLVFTMTFLPQGR